MATTRFRRSWRLGILSIIAFLVTFALLRYNRTKPPHNISIADPVLRGWTGGNRHLTTVVVAALEKDDTEWIDFQGWDVWKYEVDNPQGMHTVPKNKGHEAMVYLT